MPEICFYEPWTYQLALPEKIEAYLKFAKKKRISYEAEDCSRYNTRTNGKSAKLHPPTGPIPLIMSEARYALIPSVLVGNTI